MKEHLGSIPPFLNIEETLSWVLRETSQVPGLTSLLAIEEKRERFLSLVELRLREVRGPLVTKLQLEKNWQEGGLGITGTFLVQTMQFIEGVFDAWQKGKEREIQRQQEQKQERRVEKQEEQKNLQKEEVEILTKRYKQATGKTPEEKWIFPTSPTLVRPSLSKDKKETLVQAQQKIDERAKEMRKNNPFPLDTPVSFHSTEKPKVQDISIPQKLSGPLDELRTMRLIDFRRLAQSTSMAIEKLHDKIILLEEEGYAKKIAGVQSWRSSPIYQEYLAVNGELLEGKSLAEVLEKRKQIQGESFTEEEFQSLRSFHKDLRF